MCPFFHAMVQNRICLLFSAIDTSNKKKLVLFGLLLFLKSFSSRVCVKVSNSHIMGDSSNQGIVLFVLILVKLIPLVLNWKPGMWFSVCTIKHSLNDAPLKYLANGTDGLQEL